MGARQALAPSSWSQHVPPGQSLADEHVSGGWPPVVPLDAPVVAEPLLTMEPVPALPLVAAPLVDIPLDIAPLVVMPLVEAPLVVMPLVEAPLVVMPLVEAPLDAVPLPANPALDDPLAEELPVEDAPLEPVALVVPDELPNLKSAPPHATSAGTAVDTVTTQVKTRASSEDLMRSCRATDMPCPREHVPGSSKHLSCATMRQDGRRVMGSGNQVSFFRGPRPR